MTTQTTITPEFDLYLTDYLKAVQEYTDNDFQTNYPNLYNTDLHPKYEAVIGKRWVKVVRKDAASKSVFCFIDPVNGDIYKAATWNNPAKGVRINIHAVNRPVHGGQLYR